VEDSNPPRIRRTIPITVNDAIQMHSFPVVINQVYGQGSPGTNEVAPGSNAVSHGFIELYNPHNTAITLAGNFNIQMQNVANNTPDNTTAPNWEIFNFPAGASIPARSSYLIVSEGSNTWSNTNTNPT
jgi:hypothetical protein